MINQYLETLDSPNTKRAYATALHEFFGESPDYSNVTPKSAQDYISTLKHRGLKSSSINLRISAISSFLDYISFIQQTNANNPFKNPHLRKQQKTINTNSSITILSKTEIQKLFSVINNPRHYILFKTILQTGIRRSEAITITPKNFFKINGEWYLRIYGNSSKGISDRDIYIPNSLKKSIDSISQHNDPVFNMSTSNIYKQLQKYSKLAKIRTHISPHILRHTAATTALINGADVTEVQTMLGHQNINTTMNYVHFIDKHKNSASRKLRW